MYQIGDLIIYGSTGVCRVAGIGSPGFSPADKTKLYYELKPLYQDGTIYTPVDNTKVFMRPILTPEEVNALIDHIPFMQIESFHSPILSELSEHYNAALRTHNCADLIAMTMSIYIKKQAAQEEKRKLGSIDERYMKRAEELLFAELATALGITKSEVPDYIAARLEGKEKGGIS